MTLTLYRQDDNVEMLCQLDILFMLININSYLGVNDEVKYFTEKDRYFKFEKTNDYDGVCYTGSCETFSSNCGT